MSSSNIQDNIGIPSTIEKLVRSPASYYCMLDKESVLYSFAKGCSNISGGRKIDENSQFPMFSITKIFTAIAILQLQERGKLSLEDRVNDHLPQYPSLVELTIRHLLSHQSGLNNPIPISWIHLSSEDEAFDYQAFSSGILKSKAKRKYTPGKKSRYSNLNFLLLGEIIETLSGMDYKAYIREHVLGPNPDLGFAWKDHLAVTGYHDAGFPGWILGLLINRSRFTGPKEGKLIPFRRVYLNGSAYGGLLASPTGLNGFLQNLLSKDDVLSGPSKDKMFSEQHLNSGAPGGHSLGWFTGTLLDNRYVHHAGGGGGFYLELRIYPDLGRASYILTNKSGFSDRRLLDTLDTFHLK